MATGEMVLYAVLSGVQNTIGASVSNNGVSVPVSTFLDFPSMETLQNSVVSNTCLVSIFDHGGAKDVTRFIKYRTIPDQIVPAGVSVAVSNQNIPANSAITIQFSGVPTINDVFVLQLSLPLTLPYCYFVPTSVVTLTEYVTNVQNSINNIYSNILETSINNDTLTIKNNTDFPIFISASIGNLVNSFYEVGRRKRNIQVSVWSSQEQVRSIVGSMLETYFETVAFQFGLQLSDGTYARLELENDILMKDFQMQDIFRRDFFLDLEYSIMSTEQSYSINIFNTSNNFQGD